MPDTLEIKFPLDKRLEIELDRFICRNLTVIDNCPIPTGMTVETIGLSTAFSNRDDALSAIRSSIPKADTVIWINRPSVEFYSNPATDENGNQVASRVSEKDAKIVVIRMCAVFLKKSKQVFSKLSTPEGDPLPEFTVEKKKEPEAIAPQPEIKEKPMLTDAQLSQKLNQSAAPRVMKEHIESRIKGHSFMKIGGTLTHCAIYLDNGYIVTGESSCVNTENYRRDIGEKIAYDNAFDKLWPLFGFLMAENNHALTDPKRFKSAEETYPHIKAQDVRENSCKA